MAGQREALVQRRHDGDLGLGVQLDDALLGHAGDELDDVAQAELVEQAGRRAAFLLAADDDQRDLALGAQLGQGLEQVAQALHGDVGAGGGDEPAGDALDAGQGTEEVLVDADGHDVQPVLGDLVVGRDVVERVLRHGDDPRHARGDPGLHLGEGVPAGLRHALPLGLGVLHLEAAVDGDRVVDRGQHRQAHALHGQQAVAEALVVLHQVEVVDPAPQVLGGPHAEGQRLGEGADREGGDLDPVAERLELPEARHPHREVVVVDVEAGQLEERHPLVEDRVRLAAQDLDVVAEIDQRLGEVAGVDALAADVGLAPVGQVGDAQRLVFPWPEGGWVTSRVKGHKGVSLLAPDRSVKWSGGPATPAVTRVTAGGGIRGADGRPASAIRG